MQYMTLLITKCFDCCECKTKCTTVQFYWTVEFGCFYEVISCMYCFRFSKLVSINDYVLARFALLLAVMVQNMCVLKK